MIRENSYLKLEPVASTSDLDRGLRAEIHDPLWFLAKQWLMAEHQGEDAGVPIGVRFDASEASLWVSHPALPSPGEHPIEAIVEGSDDDFWTPGRRLRLGAAYGSAAHLPAWVRSSLLCDDLSPPYERFNGLAIDGRKAHRADPDHEVFGEVPEQRPEMYRPQSFEYRVQETIFAGRADLHIRSRGGPIDWYSCEAHGSPTWRVTVGCDTRTEPVSFPGMPNARWWEIEDADVDAARYGFDRSHFGTGLVISLLTGVSNEWYGFLWPVPAGTVTSLGNVQVIDSFEDAYDVQPPEGWSLFHIRGFDDPHLLFLVSAGAPMRGDVVEEVYLSVDEDAGSVWAHERRLAGSDVPTTGGDGVEPDASTAPPGTTHAYWPIRGVRPRVHPYRADSVGTSAQLEQGRLAEFGGERPRWMPLPEAELLGGGESVHQIEPGAVLRHGIELTRRWLLARDVSGRPVAWVRRSARPGAAPLPPPVRFDTAQRLPSGAPTPD